MNPNTLFQLTYGLFVLTSSADGQSSGCIINTAGQVTDQPNRIIITVNKTNFTHDLIKKSGIFNLSILSEDASFELFRHFGFQSGRTVDKFADFPDCKKSANDLYYLTAGANGYISAKVEQEVDLGTHTLFLAVPTEMEILSETPSATYAYYHAHIKPKPAPAATPTSESGSEQSQASGKTAWRCIICGYIYEGEELPEDYICPLCKHPASDFEKIVI